YPYPNYPSLELTSWWTLCGRPAESCITRPARLWTAVPRAELSTGGVGAPADVRDRTATIRTESPAGRSGPFCSPTWSVSPPRLQPWWRDTTRGAPGDAGARGAPGTHEAEGATRPKGPRSARGRRGRVAREP